VNWAQLPVAIWNGYDSSVEPFKVTKYDNEAIFTGSAVVVDGAGPGGKGPGSKFYNALQRILTRRHHALSAGIVNIYPGLCNKKDWPR
jgi:hypothetical protein